MKCCPKCFGDRGLRKSIFPSLTTVRGTCGYCKSEDVDLVEPMQLSAVFSQLVSIYEPLVDGKLLVDWLKEDWQLFDHSNFDTHGAKSLLSDILDNGEIVRQNFAPSPKYVSSALDRWETLRDELMYKNRYFPESEMDATRFEQLLEHLPADEMPALWYRARIRTGGELFSIDQMGPPPKRLASHGRANPPGIPYLYLGSSPRT